MYLKGCDYVENSKYHHLVPATYLKAWCKDNNSVYVLDIESNEIKPRNIYKFLGEKHFHSIKAGYPLCSEEECEIIFEELKDYKVYYKGDILSNFSDYNNKYSSFDEWIIEDRNGEKLTEKQRNKIKTKLDQKKLTDIEDKWNTKYENKWNIIRETIEYNVKHAKNGLIDEFMKGYLIKWIVSLDWRSFKSNEELNKSFDFIDEIINLSDLKIEYEERAINSCDDANKEMKHYYLLDVFRDFLDNKGGIYKQAKSYIKNTTIQFLITTEKKFITSDNPSFNYSQDGKNTIIMPVTPNILVSLIAKRSDNKYMVTRVSNEKVKELNNIIRNNASKYIISSEEDFNSAL